MDKQARHVNGTVKSRRRRTEPLSKCVARLTKPVFGKRGLADGTISRDWPAIAGDAIAAHSQPEKITYTGRERTGGLLHLRIDNSAMATQLQHLEPQFLERINSHFGYRAVARLRFLHGTLSKATLPVRQRKFRALSAEHQSRLSNALDGIKDPELRQALEQLGRVLPE